MQRLCHVYKCLFCIGLYIYIDTEPGHSVNFFDNRAVRPASPMRGAQGRPLQEADATGEECPYYADGSREGGNRA